MRGGAYPGLYFISVAGVTAAAFAFMPKGTTSLIVIFLLRTLCQIVKDVKIFLHLFSQGYATQTLASPVPDVLFYAFK